MYKYKGYIPVPVLGMVDDIIGVTLAGYNAAQMNSYLIVKSLDKYLQFGLDKCKAMVVGKIIESFHAPKLMVDTWETSHGEDGQFENKLGGKNPMENGHIPRWPKYENYQTKKEQTIKKEKNNNKSIETIWQIYF